MRRGLLLVLAFAPACSAVDRRPLSELHATQLTLYASDTNVRVGDGPNFIITLHTPNCAALDEDAVATFAGVPVELSVPDPSSFDGPGHCQGPATDQTPLPDSTFTGAPVALTIADSTETWTIAAPAIYDGDIVLASTLVAGQPATVTWTGGPPIYAAIADLDQTPLDATVPTDSAMQSNAVTVAIPAATPVGPSRATIELDGDFDPGTSPCIGPASCDVELVVSAQFDIGIAAQ
ncbi:MAG TPA: hypothetical protein VGG74_31830 [Kofleriaceae bacterium]|jgi:hypothetical protein